MNHERIHIRQQLELLILPFYVLYLIEFAIGIFKYKNRLNAYLNISFEREAYKHDFDLNYLKCRNWWAWKDFINSLRHFSYIYSKLIRYSFHHKRQSPDH